jgi:hypothetical protein
MRVVALFILPTVVAAAVPVRFDAETSHPHSLVARQPEAVQSAAVSRQQLRAHGADPECDGYCEDMEDDQETCYYVFSQYDCHGWAWHVGPTHERNSVGDQHVTGTYEYGPYYCGPTHYSCEPQLTGDELEAISNAVAFGAMSRPLLKLSGGVHPAHATALSGTVPSAFTWCLCSAAVSLGMAV